MSGGPNLTICMIVFAVLLITLPFAYLKERKAKKSQMEENDVKADAAETQKEHARH